jgi:hypothetical protein
MFDQNPFTEEGRTRFRNFGRRLGGYLALSFVLGLLAGYGVWRTWTRANMQPLQKLYLKQYAIGSLKALVSEKAVSKYTLLTCPVSGPGGKQTTGGVLDDYVHPIRDSERRPIRNENGYVFAWNSKQYRGELFWQKITMNDRNMATIFRDYHYGGASFSELLWPAAIVGLCVFVCCSVALVVFDQWLNRKYERGKFLRGTRLVEPDKYVLESDSNGLGVPSLSMRKRGLLNRLRRDEEIYWLRVPREEEAAHTTLFGDTGTGKSQLTHLFLWQIARRRPQEAIIIYDPAGEFLASHFVADRGDIVLNPLDERFPFWNPAAEARLKTDWDMIAESFLAVSEKGMQNEFFLKASRRIFAKLLESNPSPRQLVSWLTDEDAIDARVEGTELVHLINRSAAPQRVGVLATLSETGKHLGMLPQLNECTREVSLTRWAEQRQGWIFVTSTQDTRSQLRPLHGIFLDLLMKRLMACEPAWGARHPTWLIVDEAHALGRLPALYTALTEGRKFGLKLIIGTQNKNQFEEKYGRSAATMLSAAVTKISFRCNEPESAKWVSELIGEEEIEKPRTGVTAAVSGQGRDSINYSSLVERRAVVSREEIMGLPKLHGYWKFGDTVAPFRFEARSWPQRADRFLPRQMMIAGDPAGKGEETPPKNISTPPNPGEEITETASQGLELVEMEDVTAQLANEEPEQKRDIEQEPPKAHPAYDQVAGGYDLGI